MHTKLSVAENPGMFKINGDVSEKDIFDIARTLAKERLSGRHLITSPAKAKEYLMPFLMNHEREHFVVVFLNNKHGIIKTETMFLGTIDESQVSPREIIKEVLACNAAAVILGHNHPSGCAEPGQKDIRTTKRIVRTLELIGVRVVDHIVVGDGMYTSLAELGHIST